MGCGVYWSQINEVDRALRSLTRLGIVSDNPAYKQLFQLRGKLMSQVGFKFPRTLTAIAKLFGLSPGTLTLWHDPECGWLVAARPEPGADQFYHHVDDEVAVAIIKKELTPELHDWLFTPEDDYIA